MFRLDGPSAAVLDALEGGDLAHAALVERLAPRFPPPLVEETVQELLAAQAVRTVVAALPPPSSGAEGPRRRIPLTTLVMNVTSKCNLSCKYCYEYGEDRIVESASKPRFMSKAEVPADVAQRERDIATARAKDSGKPAEIIAKMVEGGVNKFLGEITLLGQPFVKDDKQTIEKMLAARKTKLHAYRFLVVGEGIEKQASDFAAEVAAMVR